MQEQHREMAPGKITDGPGLLVDRSTKTLRHLALEKIRTAILELQFQPGERLVERALCEQLGVSRTVVREVLRHLEAEGLVETIPRRGPAVARLDPSRIEQIYELRSILEALAAQLCAERASPGDVASLKAALAQVRAGYGARSPTAVLRATTEFYETMFRAAGRAVAWDVVTSLNGRINHLRATTIATKGREKEGVAEMQRIFDAIAERDPAAAYAASIEHVRSAMHLALLQVGSSDRRSSG
jgi:DNA-binding GntR family transcriptional regulator